MVLHTLLHVARGFAMGSADIVPGVSGGTVSPVLGIDRFASRHPDAEPHEPTEASAGDEPAEAAT